MFKNNEMTTLMWKRALEQSLHYDAKKSVDNWYARSTMFNGSSASFVKSMGGTATAKAVYGVSIELGSGKLLKESAFDVAIADDATKRIETIISVGLFARGLSSFAGGSTDDATDSDESAMAG